MSAPNLDPVPVVVERNHLIPMPDGVELAADCYRPAEPDRRPAILTFIPYHKDGGNGAGVKAASPPSRRSREP